MNKLVVIISLLFCVLLCSFCYAQNATSYYLNIHQYNYPNNPLPKNCEVYSVSTNIKYRTIFTFDSRGEKLSLKDLKDTHSIAPKLYAFSKYHKPKAPHENGFLLTMNIDDIELYHKYSGKDNLYNIYSTYKLMLAITYRDNVIISDTINYNEVEGSFTSGLSAEDVHIIANNKEIELAHNLNGKILSTVGYTFNSFAKNAIDLSFFKSYIKFYGISKSKKLASGDQIKILEKRIKALESLDKDIFNRDIFNKELDDLIKLFIDLKQSEDYKNHSSFKFYLHANLASLYTLKEKFEMAKTNYDFGLLYNDKEKFNRIIKEEKLKMEYRKKNKSILFDNNNFNEAYSNQYLEIFKTRKRVIN